MPLEQPITTFQCVGNYDLIEKIAEGGMGTVYKARQRDTGEVVAIKEARNTRQLQASARPGGAQMQPRVLRRRHGAAPCASG